MTYPKHLGELSIEQDAAILATLLDIASAGISDPLVTWDIEPLTDCTYDIGTVDKQFRDLYLCSDLFMGDSGQITAAVGGSSPTMQIYTDAASADGAATLDLMAQGVSASKGARIELQSGNLAQIRFSVESSADLVVMWDTYVLFEQNVIIKGGLSLGLQQTPQTGLLRGYYRGDPTFPSLNGEYQLWLSNGSGLGADGDLLLSIRKGGFWRLFTLASYDAGAGNNLVNEYLYHAGDLDTYLRFQTDQATLFAGGVGIDINTAAGLCHIDQNDNAAAVPVLHLEQDDISEEFVRFTGQSASAVLTQSLVDVGDVGTFSPVGYLKINVQDEGDQITDGPYYVEFGSLS